MKKLFSILILNTEGKISWTAISALFSIVIGVHTYVHIWWLGRVYDAALLQFALEIILTGLGVRGAQRGLQYLGEGVGSISRKTAQPEAAKAAPNAPAKAAPKKAAPNMVAYQPANHFKIEEFNSKDGVPMPEPVRQNIIRHIQNLEVIRAELGGKPMLITSGYRSPAQNKKVDGKPNSQHLVGNAADFKVVGVKPSVVAKTVKRLMDSGMIEAGGLKAYSTFVHYDRRGEYVTW